MGIAADQRESNGKRAQLAVVTEENSVAAASLLQRCHDGDPPQHHSNVRQTTLPKFYQVAGEGKGQEATNNRNLLP